MAGIIELDWNGSHGHVSFADKYTLLYTKPSLGFAFDVLHYAKGDLVYPSGFRLTSPSGGMELLTPEQVQEVETYCEENASTTWANLCSLP